MASHLSAVEFAGVYLAETDHAILIELEDGLGVSRRVWFPKSYTDLDIPEHRRVAGEVYDFSCAAWLAEQEGVD